MHAIAGARQGGAEAFFERLTLALAAAGVRQHAVVRNDPVRATLLRDAGVTVTETRFGGPLDLLSRWRFRKAITHFQPNIVLTWMNRASIACPVATPRNPFLHVGRLGDYYNIKYYRHCRYLIGNTPDICRWLVEDMGRDPSTVQYLPNFAAETVATDIPPRAPEHPPVIFALGRLHTNKGFDTLITALARVNRAELWLAGIGPERAALQDLTKRLGLEERVRFLGWREDIPALHAQADVFVCPSRHEALGNVVVEAMAQGKAVVATASQGPSQMIADGDNGLLVPIDDAEALAQALNRVIADKALRQRLEQAGLAYYRANFSQAAVVARYCEFFQRILT